MKISTLVTRGRHTCDERGRVDAVMILDVALKVPAEEAHRVLSFLRYDEQQLDLTIDESGMHLRNPDTMTPPGLTRSTNGDTESLDASLQRAVADGDTAMPDLPLVTDEEAERLGRFVRERFEKAAAKTEELGLKLDEMSRSEARVESSKRER